MLSDPVLPPAPVGSATREALYRAALGPAHAEHYLPVFSRFDERGNNGPAWNASAALGNLGWLVYRQLWGAAGEFAVALGVWALIAAGLAFWADFLPPGVRAGLALALLLVLLLVPGLYGTALLHAQVVRRTIAAVGQASTMEEACTLLRQQGEVHRRRTAWGMAGLLLAAAIAGAMWTAKPTQAVSPPVVFGSILAADLAQAKAVAPNASVSVQSAIATPPVAPGALLATPAESVAAPEIPVVQMAKPVDTMPLPAQAQAGAALPEAGGVRRIKAHGVNVGLFAVAENAQRIEAKLSGVGLPVLKDLVESANGPLTRVRVGPFERRDQAQAAAVRVRALGLDARVYAP